jgi:hypothetical protein
VGNTKQPGCQKYPQETIMLSLIILNKDLI